MTPREARLLCSLDDPAAAVASLRRAAVAPGHLVELLRRPWTPRLVPGTTTVELSDERGRRTELAVRIPEVRPGQRPGVLIMLHGSGSSAAKVLPYFEGLARRLGLVTLCPNAQYVGGADVLGRLLGDRARAPSWSYHRDDFPLAALRWALDNLDVDPDRCVLAGVSMGGFACWNLGMRFWHHFAAVVPMAGGLSRWEAFGSDSQSRFLLHNALAVALFVIHGALDDQIPPAFDRASVAQLRELGHPAVEYVEVADGTHALRSLHLGEGAELLARLEHWLAGQRRDPDPATVRHRAIDDQHGRAHWAQLVGVDLRRGADLRAQRLSADRYRIDITGAHGVRLHLTGNGLVAGQPIEVTVNGHRSTVRFAPDLATVVASHRRDVDPALLAEQIVEFAVSTGETNRSTRHVNEREHADTF